MIWKEEEDPPKETLWRSELSALHAADGCADVTATGPEVRPIQMKAENLRGHQERQAVLCPKTTSLLLFMALSKALKDVSLSFLHLIQVYTC